MSESKFRQKICKGLRNCNAEVIPYVASMRNSNHVPDVIIVHKWWRGFIEFKGEMTRLRPGQKIFIRQMLNKDPQSVVIFREPGIILDPEGNELGRAATGKELLEWLRDYFSKEIKNEAN